jgi:hypothetical protein
VARYRETPPGGHAVEVARFRWPSPRDLIL